jgi:cytochrome c-type biogenesis protein CcmH/NrfG
VLSLVTLGIYTIVWYYKVNREVRDYGQAQGDAELAQSNPTNSVLAVTLGALVIVPAIISYYRTVQRVQRAQQLGGAEVTNGWLVLVLILVISIAAPAYIQSGLNKLWERYQASGQAGIPAPPPAAAAPPPAQQPATQQPPAGGTPPPPETPSG